MSSIPRDDGTNLSINRLARRVLAAFVFTFVIARSLVILMRLGLLPDFYVQLGETHFHHLNYGIFLLTAVGAYLLFVRPGGRGLATAAILYGIGLGLTFDEFGKLTTINRAGTEIFGFQSSTDVGKEFRGLFSGTANARLASLAGEVLAQQRGRKAFDVRFLRRDGSSFSLDLNVLPLQDVQSNFLGGVMVAEDITHEQRLMNTLCRYMAREVAEQVMQNKDELKLGGTRTEVTILITDIRNFTSISEQMDPWDVVDLLNTYFPRMINVFFRHQGMVDKFIGDSILAVFGVPVPKEDDALRAVRAAVEMRKELRSINRERALKGQRTIEIGIGITSGTVISGNIGSERRMDYTVIGDPVNLAARLEGLTKEVQRMILVDERVEKVIRNEIPCEALGLFAVKGKREQVPVFAVKTSGRDS